MERTFSRLAGADLCATLEKNKGYILLDVRSPGEYADTSTFASYNLGHLKGARNIDVGQLGKRLSEIKEYKDTTYANRDVLEINVDRGHKIHIRNIIIEGNKAIKSSKLKRAMKNTKEKIWWKIFTSSTSCCFWRCFSISPGGRLTSWRRHFGCDTRSFA